MFPHTVEEYALLLAEGKTVIYEETPDQTPPAGTGWELWSMRVQPDVAVYVWRRIITLEEAGELA